jgi:putative endonuclease
MFYVYILFSELDKLLYTGFCDDLKSRFEKHQKGFVKATKHRRPLKLIYYESYSNELDARRREIFSMGAMERLLLKFNLKRFLRK